MGFYNQGLGTALNLSGFLRQAESGKIIFSRPRVGGRVRVLLLLTVWELYTARRYLVFMLV